jgi:hypothetical protein
LTLIISSLRPPDIETVSAVLPFPRSLAWSANAVARPILGHEWLAAFQTDFFNNADWRIAARLFHADHLPATGISAVSTRYSNSAWVAQAGQASMPPTMTMVKSLR